VVGEPSIKKLKLTEDKLDESGARLVHSRQKSLTCLGKELGD
jgi:hypothetical protein